MKRLTLTASVVLAVAVPGSASAQLSHRQRRAYFVAYAHVTQVLGVRAAGCKLLGADRTCHEPASDRRVLDSTLVLHRIAAGGAHVASAAPRSSPSASGAMNGPVVASYYDLSGIGSCGVSAQSGYAFASLFLPCGAQVVMCNGSTCVTATMDDHGPYVAGRTFDLNVALRDALGCSDLCSVTWRSA